MPQYAPVIDVNGLPRTFKQADCRLEPGFMAEDNCLFYASAPDYLSHGEHDECEYRGDSKGLPHKIADCPWFLTIGKTGDQSGCEECEAEFDEVTFGALFDCLGCNAKLCLFCHYDHFIEHGIAIYDEFAND